MRKIALFLVVSAALAFPVQAPAGEPRQDEFGCEANPTGSPVGGGDGYKHVVTEGDVVVATADALVSALREAQDGDVVCVNGGTDINMTGHENIVIPGGITLAGNRGTGGASGPRLFTTDRDTNPLFRTGGPRARVTGLRLEGPYGGTEQIPTYALCIETRHYGLEVDNCEIYNWNYVGVAGRYGAAALNVHHCYIHHCTRGGLGYGVSLDRCDARIIANIFDHCRHHIAATGRPGCAYEAAYNLALPHAISHHFDMHGGRDRGDGTDIAGDWIDIHHNTFQSPRQRAVVIRGVPCQGAAIHHNWFAASPEKTVVSGGNTKVYDNVYGPDKTLEE